MKKLLIFLFLPFLLSAQQNRIVTGHLSYNRYDYQPGEVTILRFNNQSVSVIVDSINEKTVRTLLNKSGIKDSSIIYAAGFGSSTLDKIECFFAFKGVMNGSRLDFCTQNSHHLYCDYAAQDAILIPQFQMLDIVPLQNLAFDIALKYPVTSFMIKPFVFPGLPHLVITKNIPDGVLADMRNIDKSVRLKDYFIDLNYQIIWYKDLDGKAKTIFRMPAKKTLGLFVGKPDYKVQSSSTIDLTIIPDGHLYVEEFKNMNYKKIIYTDPLGNTIKLKRPSDGW